MRNKSTVFLDILGISSAGLCMVHCLIFTILSVFPFGFSNTHRIDIFFACISMFIVSKIIQTDTSILVKTILPISLLIIISGVVIELLFATATPLVIIGGLGMILGYMLNFNTHKHLKYEK